MVETPLSKEHLVEQNQRLAWPPTKQQVLTIIIIVALALVITMVGGYVLGWEWTGFAKQTLWNWLGLLIIPVVLVLGGYLFTDSQNHRAQMIAEQRAQDNALQAYLDQMSQLLADKGLRNKKHWLDDARVTARARSLTVLRQLYGDRKKSILQFLYEAQLINKAEKPGPDDHTFSARIVGLGGADLKDANLRYVTLEGAALDGAILENADLRYAKLSGIDLGGAYLSGADLRGANLSKASLREAQLQRKDELNLRGADLTDADLSGADFTDAKVSNEQLATCMSLEGATMPDGTLHP
jgi:uncharacterized protein YjbI with pentapeptide repeats